MTCQWPDKKKYADKAEALEAIRSLYRAGRGNPDYSAYPCGKHWHVGHSAKHFQRRIQAVRNVKVYARRQAAKRSRRKRR